ncbi:hypothetical protein TKK_0004888 [Trichogramma kaykai]
MAASFHDSIVNKSKVDIKYGINYLEILDRLSEKTLFWSHSVDDLWQSIPLDLRVVVSKITFLILTCTNKDNLLLCVKQLVFNINNFRPWFYPPDLILSDNLMSALSSIRNSSLPFATLITQPEPAPDDDDYSADVSRAIHYLRRVSPLLEVWMASDPANVAWFFASKFERINIRDKYPGHKFVERSLGEVPYWVPHVTSSTLTRAQARLLAKGYLYTSATDKRHMSTNVAAYLTALLNGGWRQNYEEAYPSTHPPDQRATVTHLNSILNLLPLGLPQPLVLVVLLSLGADTLLPDPVFDYIVKFRVLNLSLPRTLSVLNELSTCLRRCSMTPLKVAVSDDLTCRYSYWYLTSGRSLLVSDWRQEMVNRTTKTYHIRSDLDFHRPLTWRKESTAYEQEDPDFYRRFCEHATRVFMELLPDKMSHETFYDFLLRRNEWMTSGSSGGEFVVVDGVKISVNKRGFVESIKAQEYAKLLYTAFPNENATGSEKMENGRARAIYGTKILHYILSSYATHGLEERLSHVNSLEKSYSGAALMNREAKRARLSGDPTKHLSMFNYSDFNIQHSPEVQKLLFETCAEVGAARGCPKDWFVAHHWLAQSKLNMTATFPDPDRSGAHVFKHVVQGMFSGTRSTDLINTICNLIYLKIAMDIVREKFSLEPVNLYNVHQGDDVWVSNENSLWAAVLFFTMNRMGFVFNSAKQMLGSMRGEFLRVLYSKGQALGYSARALVNLILRPVQNSLVTELEKHDKWETKLAAFLQRWVNVPGITMSQENQAAFYTSVYRRLQAVQAYDASVAGKIKMPIMLLKPTQPTLRAVPEDYLLGEVTSDKVEVHYVEGNHVTILDHNKIAKAINGEPLEDAEEFKQLIFQGEIDKVASLVMESAVLLEPSRTPRSTIPRLELRAALIAARLLRTICDELAIDINTCVAWSDSRIVLHWIDSTEAIGNSVVDG